MQILPKAARLKIFNCLNWCCANFSSDVHWQGKAHSLLSLRWVSMEWRKQGIGYRRASHAAVPPHIFPTIPYYKVILTENCITTMEKFQFVFENPKYRQIHLWFFASSKLLAKEALLWKRCLFLSANILNIRRKLIISPLLFFTVAKIKTANGMPLHYQKFKCFRVFVSCVGDGLCIWAFSVRISKVHIPSNKNILPADGKAKLLPYLANAFV